MNEIISSIIEVSKIIDEKEKSKEIANSLSKRIENIRRNYNKKKIKVLAIEWIGLFYCRSLDPRNDRDSRRD